MGCSRAVYFPLSNSGRYYSPPPPPPSGAPPVCISQELKGLKDGEDAEEGASEEGVTFDLWKKTEMPPPLEPVFDEVDAYLKATLHILYIFIYIY